MKDIHAYKTILLSAVVTMVLAAGPGTAADTSSAGISRTLERSSLSPGERSNLVGQAGRAVDAGIPLADVEVIIGRGLARGADAVTLSNYLDTAVRTQQQGLPVRPVLDRIQQGLSKNVAPARIDQASRRLADELASAQKLVDELLRRGMDQGTGKGRDEALASMAHAAEHNVSAETIRSLGETARIRGQALPQFGRAVGTLTFLTEAGLPGDAAHHVVEVCLDRGCTGQDLGRIERTVSEMSRQGRSAEDIVHAAEREAREVRDGDKRRDSAGRDRGFMTDREAGGRGGRGRY